MIHHRYEAVEKSRQEYRENARKLVVENEALQSAVNQVGTREREREREGGGVVERVHCKRFQLYELRLEWIKCCACMCSHVFLYNTVRLSEIQWR